MIIETLFELVKLLLTTVLGVLPNLPAMPEALINSINYILDLLFNEGASLLGFFVRIDTIKLIAPIAVLIFNLDKIYSLILWVIKKLPLGMK